MARGSAFSVFERLVVAHSIRHGWSIRNTAAFLGRSISGVAQLRTRMMFDGSDRQLCLFGFELDRLFAEWQRSGGGDA
jgi:hypothetical protein